MCICLTRLVRRRRSQDAEQEQAEKGDASELHIVIFDEIDAICKKRGSTRDGTGVHDSIVNQVRAQTAALFAAQCASCIVLVQPNLSSGLLALPSLH